MGVRQFTLCFILLYLLVSSALPAQSSMNTWLMNAEPQLNQFRAKKEVVVSLAPWEDLRTFRERTPYSHLNAVSIVWNYPDRKAKDILNAFKEQRDFFQNPPFHGLIELHFPAQEPKNFNAIRQGMLQPMKGILDSLDQAALFDGNAVQVILDYQVISPAERDQETLELISREIENRLAGIKIPLVQVEPSSGLYYSLEGLPFRLLENWKEKDKKIILRTYHSNLTPVQVDSLAYLVQWEQVDSSITFLIDHAGIQPQNILLEVPLMGLEIKEQAAPKLVPWNNFREGLTGLDSISLYEGNLLAGNYTYPDFPFIFQRVNELGLGGVSLVGAVAYGKCSATYSVPAGTGKEFMSGIGDALKSVRRIPTYFKPTGITKVMKQFSKDKPAINSELCGTIFWEGHLMKHFFKPPPKYQYFLFPYMLACFIVFWRTPFVISKTQNYWAKPKHYTIRLIIWLVILVFFIVFAPFWAVVIWMFLPASFSSFYAFLTNAKAVKTSVNSGKKFFNIIRNPKRGIKYLFKPLPLPSGREPDKLEFSLNSAEERRQYYIAIFLFLIIATATGAMVFLGNNYLTEFIIYFSICILLGVFFFKYAFNKHQNMIYTLYLEEKEQEDPYV